MSKILSTLLLFLGGLHLLIFTLTSLPFPRTLIATPDAATCFFLMAIAIRVIFGRSGD